MKKIISLVLCTILVGSLFALVGCNRKQKNVETGYYYLNSKRLDGEPMPDINGDGEPDESYIEIKDNEALEARIYNLLIYEVENRNNKKDSVISAYNTTYFKYTKNDKEKTFDFKPAPGVYFSGVWDGAKTLTLDEYFGSIKYVKP